jgi:hypothetical protein
MKLESGIIIAKGACYVFIGVFTPWASALAQWANSGDSPPRIIWLGVILPASVIGGASGLLAFLSGSYSDYMANRSQQTKPTETKP